MKVISEQLRSVLYEAGAKLVGFADLKDSVEGNLIYGAAVVVPIPIPIIQAIQDGPTKEYLDTYHELNAKLDAIVTSGAKFLEQEGYEALAQTTSVVVWEEGFRTKLPHKTVATRAGLGWIGKSCLLVTPEYGSAVRISSLLTNAPLSCAQPIETSRCNTCHACVDICPANALTGVLWNPQIDRSKLLLEKSCKQKQLEIMRERTGIEADLCGQCFVVCPYTRKYVKSSAVF
ncbi:MAG: 4Fe-4S double cluster binding domain-containing protein [Lachnospiraceae bacterium]